jgi:hypothetical protein
MPHFGVDIAASKFADSCLQMVRFRLPSRLTDWGNVADHSYGVSTVYIHQNRPRKGGDAVKRGD